MAFEVYPAGGFSSGCLEELTGFASQEDDLVFSLLEQVLTIVINDELGGFRIGLKCEFLRNVTEFQVRFESTA